MSQQVRIGDHAVVHGDDDGRSLEISDTLACKRLAIVNVMFVGARGSREWALVDAGVPGMPGWRMIHTPGHTPGHISLWSPGTRTLIAGDAFITTAQESAYAVAMQKPEVHGPPMYYTPDWASAHASVVKLAALEPNLVVTGHGPAMQGDQVIAALRLLARDFNDLAVPKQGRDVERRPA